MKSQTHLMAHLMTLNLPVRLAHTLHDEIFPLAQNL